MTTPIAVVLSSLFGLLFGSFANVAIYRLPRRQSVVHPPSACPACGVHIAAKDNVPVVSWVLLRGRCRNCGTVISLRYPTVELAVAVIWALVAARHGPVSYLPALLLFTWGLVVGGVVDLAHRIIPNRLTLSLPPILLVLLAVDGALRSSWVPLVRGLIVAVALPAGMLALSEAFRYLRGKQGIGMGDVKFAVSLGLVLGYLGGWYVVIGLYATIISAALIAFGLIAAGRARLASRIPFGPYLAVGALVAILAGEPISAAVSSWLGLA